MFGHEKDVQIVASTNFPFNMKDKLPCSLFGSGFHTVLESIFDTFAFMVKSFNIGKSGKKERKIFQRNASKTKTTQSNKSRIKLSLTSQELPGSRIRRGKKNG